MSLQKKFLIAALLVGVAGAGALVYTTRSGHPHAAPAAKSAPAPAVQGMPLVKDPHNLYSETGPLALSHAVRGQLSRVYVPNLRTNDLYVIDPDSMKVVDRYKVGTAPQHVVPSWDLQTLWVANNSERHEDGSLTPIDPYTGKAGAAVPVDDPYNMYYTPDGRSAIVVAEARKRLDFRDPKTMAMQYSIQTECGGINHADFSIDGRFVLFTCEFNGSLVKIDLVDKKVIGYLKLQMPATRFKESRKAFDPSNTEICRAKKGMPQDIRVSPDGKLFYVADMDADGVHVVDGDRFEQIDFITTGPGTHGLYPSRDGKSLYITFRGTHRIHGLRKGPGGVSVMDFATRKIIAQWPVPGGGSPDMGNVSVDGKSLWLSGRFDDVVYKIDTATGAYTQIKVGGEPHGLTVWPQPGRYSLGHTGNMR